MVSQVRCVDFKDKHLFKVNTYSDVMTYLETQLVVSESSLKSGLKDAARLVYFKI